MVPMYNWLNNVFDNCLHNLGYAFSYTVDEVWLFCAFCLEKVFYVYFTFYYITQGLLRCNTVAVRVRGFSIYVLKISWYIYWRILNVPVLFN